jgi:SAM-dependent methyltransferase
MGKSFTSSQNWFEQSGAAYAAFRPEYPKDLVSYLVSVAPDKQLALDVGCGTGQLTKLLATQFEQVVGIDPSSDQVAHAVECFNVFYHRLPAEQFSCLGDKGADLITAAQAAHWFELPRFYDEARRVLKHNGVLALISYGVLKIESECNERFQKFYTDEIGPFWPPERQLVDTGYATIQFPFEELEHPSLEIRLEWNLPELLGYISTWSAAQNARKNGRAELLQHFADDMVRMWGE